MADKTGRRALIALALAIIAVVAMVVGCSKSSKSGASEGSGAARADATVAGAPQFAAAEPAAVPAPAATSAGGGSSTSSKTSVLSNIDIGSTSQIKLAELTVTVKNVSQADSSAATTAQSVGGQVFSDNQQASASDKQTTGSADMVLKVPPVSLNDALDQLGKLGTINSTQTSTQDVTGQVADVSSRVTSALASIARLQTLFDKASSVTDIVALENQLSQREADLESLQAQQRALSAETSFATITLHLVKAGTTPPPPKKKHHDSGFVAGIKSGWHSFTTALGWGLAGIGAVLPFVVLLALIGWAVLIVRRRMFKGTAPKPLVESGPGIVE